MQPVRCSPYRSTSMSRSPQRSHCILAALLDHPRLLPKRDELVGPALHRFLVCSDGRRIICDQRDQRLDTLILVIPTFDTKREIAVIAAAAHKQYENQKRTTSMPRPLIQCGSHLICAQ